MDCGEKRIVGYNFIRILKCKWLTRRNEKYTPEMREQTAAYILESGKSATKTAKEMGIDVNTVCRWVQDYRKKHNLPSYAEEKGIKLILLFYT